ncbi:hypothetical protein ACJX0J_021751, partial [Zea mays]
QLRERGRPPRYGVRVRRRGGAGPGPVPRRRQALLRDLRQDGEGLQRNHRLRGHAQEQAGDHGRRAQAEARHRRQHQQGLRGGGQGQDRKNPCCIRPGGRR